ncbi:MAG TPA: VWA domain-containing protein [Herpetosiphonaceae bacterium]
MRLSFIYPNLLWLLLLIGPLLALALLAPRRLPVVRFWSSIVLRLLLFVLLVGALAGTQVVRRVDELTTVFLVDSSDSVSPEDRTRAEAFIQSALATMREGDKAAIVAFGENALVERAPSTEQALRRLQSVPVTTRTNIGEAINLGLALLPADTQKRLVLLSDGGENAGDIFSAVALARARNVPIEVVSLSETANDVVQVSELRAPSTVRKGQNIPLDVVVESSVDTAATIRLRSSAGVIEERPVELKAGRQTIPFSVRAESDGFARYTAEIEVANDTRAQNNQAAALIDVQGEPRVLLVEGKAGEAANLATALQTAQMNPTIVAPETMPTNLAELGGYDAVALVNVAAGRLPASSMKLLPSYVRDLGRGLVMVGGDRAYGMGGYNRTPVEEALPVNMEVKDKQRRPDIAIVFVIDKSGSMAACHCNSPDRAGMPEGGVVKVDIAKEAVVQASALLQPDDQLGVVAFDSVPHWAVDVSKVPSLEEITEAVAPIAPDGQTNVRGGLLAAKEALEKSDAKVKHVILLTDGWSSAGQQTGIANELRSAGITLSTVAAGGGSAPYLEELAEAGGGRYYPVVNMEDVPQIFVEETVKTIGSYIIEQQFVPGLAGDSPILRGLTDQGWPSLYGYNGTELKDAAQLILQSPEGDPVLAQWQYGLGRAVAWTSDFKGQWGTDLVRWQQFGTFAAQMIAWTVPRQAENELNAQTRIEGTQAIVTAEAKSQDGTALPDAQVTATLVSPDGSSQSLPLRQVGPGQFQASIPNPQTGSYLVQVNAQNQGQPIGQQMVGLVVPYSPEYRQQQSNVALLERIAQETGGKPLETPAAAFEHNLAAVQRAQEISIPLLLLVLLLLPLDIAVRRLSLRRRDFAEARAWAGAHIPTRRTSPAAAQPLMGELHRAKARAATRGARRNTAEEQITPPAEVQPTTTQRPQRAAPRVERPSAEETRQAAESAAPPAPTAEDSIARLRAAKERARRK